MNKVIVEIRNGSIVDVYHTNEDVELIVIDWDSFEEDEDNYQADLWTSLDLNTEAPDEVHDVVEGMV